LPWVRTGPATGGTCGMTELIAVLTGAIGAVIGATLLATGINCGATFDTGITGLLVTNAGIFVVTSAICEATVATCVPTVATSGTTAEIFERVSGKEFDRSYFEEPNNGGSNLPPTLRLISYDESLCDPFVLCG
jgi:hypothetical protein